MTSTLMRPHSASLVFLLCALPACTRERSPAAAGAPVARVALDEFGRFDWIEGRWRGADGAGAPFFEAYHFLNDSTIRSYDYPDSTFTTASDSGVIRLRGDSVTSGGETPRWVAVRFDSVEAEFVAIGDSRRGFTWTYTGPGRWSARLRWDSAGVGRERVYQMHARP